MDPGVGTLPGIATLRPAAEAQSSHGGRRTLTVLLGCTGDNTPCARDGSTVAISGLDAGRTVSLRIERPFAVQ